MPLVSPGLIASASGALYEVAGGARASAELARTIAEGRLGAAEAEQLSAVVYGALRRQRRTRAALGELGVYADGMNAARLEVIAAAMLDDASMFDLESARAAWSEIAWQRLASADAAVLARARGAERLALL